MKKAILLFSAVLLFATACRLEKLPLSDYTTNPFLTKKSLSTDVVSQVSFSAITDVHFGREKSMSNLKWFEDNYYEFLEEKHYPFIMQLGDFSDDGTFTSGREDPFISTAKEKSGITSSANFINVLGNHDRHNLSPRWNNDENFMIAEAYSYGKTSDGRDLLTIYKLDNTTRTIGIDQFEYLEEALKEDNSEYKIFIAHEIVASGGTLDMSLILFGLNVEDQTKMYKLMNKYKVGLILTGHHHIGNIEYHFDDTHGECNLAAFHQRKTQPFEFESLGYWYDVTLDADSGKVTITPYLAETKEAKTPFIYYLPKNE